MNKKINFVAVVLLLVLCSFSFFINHASSVNIKVVSGAILEGCGNEIIIEGDDALQNFKPEMTVEGAVVLRSKTEENNFVIIPVLGRREITISVFHQGEKIKIETLPVWKLPEPQFLLYSGAELAKTKVGEAAPGPEALFVQVVPDKNLLRFFPNDATYALENIEVLLVRGKRPVNARRISATEKIDLAHIQDMAQPGDRIIVDLKEASRTNFRGEKQKVDVSNVLWNIPLY